MSQIELIKKSKAFKEMTHEGLQKLVIDLLDDKNNLDDVACQTDVVMKIVMNMITDGGQYKEGSPRVWVDILAAAAFCYFAYFNKKHEVSSLYQVRDYVVMHEDENGTIYSCTPNILEALCETVECSRGCRTKVRKCFPAPNSPQQVLGDVIWYTERFPLAYEERN